MQDTTLIYLYKPKEGEILLAMKKRGLGAGKWNGIGGKLEGNETVFENAVRETKEEICVDIKGEDLEKVADIDFFFDGKEEWDQHVHIFFLEKWQGEPMETEEMKPRWCKIDEIPYGDMWIDDILWMPRVFAGEKLKCAFTFNSDGSQILKQNIFVI